MSSSFKELNAAIGWKSYFKTGTSQRFKCCQASKGCECELKIALIKDDPEDYISFEIKVEVSGEHTNHDKEEVERFINKRKALG